MNPKIHKKLAKLVTSVTLVNLHKSKVENLKKRIHVPTGISYISLLWLAPVVLEYFPLVWPEAEEGPTGSYSALLWLPKEDPKWRVGELVPLVAEKKSFKVELILFTNTRVQFFWCYNELNCIASIVQHI